MVWLVPQPGSCLPSPCLQVLWASEGSALPILELSSSHGPCWHSCCHQGTVGWAVLGGRAARVPAQAWPGLAEPVVPPRVRCS